MRGVWCQALSLPWPSAVWGGRPGFRDPCVPDAVGAGVGPSTGPTACALAGRRCSLWGWEKGVPGGAAFHRSRGASVVRCSPSPNCPPTGRAVGVPRPVCPGCGWCRRGTQHRPHSVRPCGPALLAVGVAEGRSRGGCLPPFPRGVCGQVLPLPELPAHWAGCWGPRPRCCGHGRVGLGAQHCPLGLHALWGLRAAGVVGGHPRGGRPASVVRGVWCQALSLSQPPALWGGRPRFCDRCVLGAVGAGPGTQHLPHSVRPCGPALLAVGVAEGRLRGGCLPPL